MTPVKKWKDAHQSIEITDEALATMAPFPSLYANDFIAYLQSKEVSPEIVAFVRDISRELVWAYDNWAKAQRDGDPARLLADILTAARHGEEYAFTNKFLNDYAKANNIAVHQPSSQPSWMDEMSNAAAQFAPAQQ